MDPRNPTAALFVILAIAYLANATQSIGDCASRYIGQGVGKNGSGSTPFLAAHHYRRRDDSKTVQVLYHFGTKSLSVDCSSTHCLVVLSNAGEA